METISQTRHKKIVDELLTETTEMIDHIAELHAIISQLTTKLTFEQACFNDISNEYDILEEKYNKLKSK